MITPEYVVTMARYNIWQNRQLNDAMKSLPFAALTEDRGGFFGSIFATVNHVLWGDQIWMSRWSNVAKPEVGIPDSVGITKTLGDWSAARFRLDGRILLWAVELKAIDLHGDLRWHSGALGREVVKPFATCVTHMFNHQTHHRGQVHAMLTAAGATAPVSDLFAMPEEI